MSTLLLLFLAFIINDVLCGKVGTNLEGITYYSPGLKFLNRFYGAAPFKSNNASLPVDFDSNGYAKSLLPGQEVGALFMSVDKDPNSGLWHVPKSMQGIHVFLYDGDCSGCSFRWNAIVLNKSEPGRWIMNVSDQGGVHNAKCWIGVSEIPDPSNYPHNFRLVPIEHENDYQDVIFEPSWIEPIAKTGFSSMRFMDFLATNNNPISSWSERTLPSNFTMGNSRGIAWEFVIALTNQLNISAWINIPAMADDDYIKELATLWKDNYQHWGKSSSVIVAF